MSGLGEAYERRYAELERAMERLRFLLRQIEATIEDKTLVRAQVSSTRIKELGSLENKARKNGWKSDQALMECPDLIGARVVCNNVEDVYRFAALLKERLPAGSAAFEIQDYIKEPNQRGYRALHFPGDIRQIGAGLRHTASAQHLRGTPDFVPGALAEGARAERSS